MAAKNAGYRKPTGAELRAQRIALEVARVDPAEEAKRREKSMLGSFVAATRDLEWIGAHEGWKLLGFDTCAAWWESRVRPVIDALGLTPTKELGQKVVDLIVAEEAALPPSQQRSRRQLSATVGVSEWVVRTAPRSTSGRDRQRSDLDGTVVPTAEPGNVGAGVPMAAVEPDLSAQCSTAQDRAHCASGCGEPIPMHEQNAGTLRCKACDPTNLHRAIGLGFEEGWGECERCKRIAAELAKTSAADAAANPEDASPLLGEPVEVEQPQAGAGPESDGTGLGSGQTEERIEDAELIGCPLCTYALEVSEVDPDASLSEMNYHLVRTHDLSGMAAADALARVRTISPAAASTPPPTARASPTSAPQQQLGPDSPTGVEGSRSETSHHTSAGVSDVGGAPEVAALVEQGLEDGGTAQDPPSSSDPEPPWVSPAEVVVRLFQAFTEDLDAVDYEAVGPELTDVDLYAIRQCDQRIAEHLARLEKFVHTP